MFIVESTLSYPVYIVHAPVIPVIRVLMRRWHVDDFTLSLLNVVAVLVCAIVLNKLVGEQVEHFRTKFKRRASAPETAANLSYARLGSKSYTQL